MRKTLCSSHIEGPNNGENSSKNNFNGILKVARRKVKIVHSTKNT